MTQKTQHNHILTELKYQEISLSEVIQLQLFLIEVDIVELYEYDHIEQH